MTATHEQATSGEVQTVVAARRLEHAKSVFIGVGRPSTAAILARMVHNPELVLVYESGTIGAKPFHIPLSIGDGELAETADAVVSSIGSTRSAKNNEQNHRHVGAQCGDRHQLLTAERARDGLDARMRRQIRAHVPAHDRARHPGGPGRVPVGHAGVAVLLDLDRVRPAVLDGVAKAVQRSHPGIAAVGEHQLAGRPHPDHLVIEDVRRHPDELQIAAPLTKDLVAGGKRDQVGEALDGDGVAIVNDLGDGVAQRRDLGHCITAVGAVCSSVSPT